MRCPDRPRRCARFPSIWGLFGRCGSCLVRPFRCSVFLAPLEVYLVSCPPPLVLSACAGVLTCSIASSTSSRPPRRSLTLLTHPLRRPGRLAWVELSQVRLLCPFALSICARVLTHCAASLARFQHPRCPLRLLGCLSCL